METIYILRDTQNKDFLRIWRVMVLTPNIYTEVCSGVSEPLKHKSEPFRNFYYSLHIPQV
jgi:hypothetical protein